MVVRLRHHGPPPAPLPEIPSVPEAVIKEARRRQRRRWLGVILGALLVAGLALGVAVGARFGGSKAKGSSGSSASGPFATAASRRWHGTGAALWFHGTPPNYLGAGRSSLVTCAGDAQGVCYVVIQANGIAPDGKPTEPSAPVAFAPFRSSAYRTTNDGRTWAQLRLPPGTWLSSPITCASGDSCAVGAVLNAGQPPNEPGSTVVVLTTRNGGRSWQEHPLPSWVGLVTHMSCPAASRCVALAWAQGAPTIDGRQPFSGVDRFYATSVLVSNDGGATWRASARLPGRAGGHDVYLSSVSCTGADCVFIGERAVIVPILGRGAYKTRDTGGVVLVSRDTGKTLSIGVRPPGWPIAVACAGPSDCLAVFGNARNGEATMLAGGPGHAWRTLHPTGLLTWTAGASSLVCPAAGHCLGVGTQIAVTTDGGERWTHTQALPAAPSGYSSDEPGSAACLPSGRCLLLEDVTPSSSPGPVAAATRVLTNSP